MIESYERARTLMVRDQLQRRGIRDPHVLEAMSQVPRERFTRIETGRPRATEAYRDGALPIGRGQTLSQPFIVAAMTQALALADDSRVLEIGTGTGYNTAVLALIAREVWTVERDAVLADEAKDRLRDLRFSNIRFRVGDGSLGWKEGSPYDGILVTAGAPDIPRSLLEQLSPGGRLVIPVGGSEHQSLISVTIGADPSQIETETLMECRFVPLIGREGWLGNQMSRRGEGL